MNYKHEVYETEPRWYAAWTRSRQEKSVSATLGALGVQHFLPVHTELRQWSDRKQLVEVPLFSGYIFVCICLTDNSKSKILRVPGVVALVGNQYGPSPIPAQQIEAIRTVLSAPVKSSVCTDLHEGQRVRVVRGALAGVEGTLLRTQTTSRLLISIELIRQSLSVNMMREDVELVGEYGVPAPSLGPSTQDFRVQPR